MCSLHSVCYTVPTISVDLNSLIYICVLFICIQKLWIKYVYVYHWFWNQPKITMVWTDILEVPFTKLKTFADWAFSTYGPKLWNTLPDHLRCIIPLRASLKPICSKSSNLYVIHICCNFTFSISTIICKAIFDNQLLYCWIGAIEINNL